MTDLENLAKNLFDKFASIQNEKANWLYLSKERKAEWLKDVLIYTDFLLKDIKNRIKPVPILGNRAASFEVGYYQGQKAAKFEIEQLLDYLDKELKLQLTEFNNKD